jgi:trimethylamine--corrinoid protein Co-methyltransferase
MLSAMRAFVKRKTPVLCSPFVQGGACRGAVERRGVAYTQMIRIGAPAMHGHDLSTVSMKSGGPMAGTPEISLMNFMIGQMERFHGEPWRTSNLLGGAKTFDAQAGSESAMTMNAVLHAGANYIWQSAGWNEAGMHCSVAKFVVDAEMCAMGLSYDFPRLPCNKGAAARHPKYAGQRRGTDREWVGRFGPCGSVIAPVFSHDLNG